ncbi:MAG: ATPase [Christensenellaceae bacterium]|jgi:vacuolar-type H+-ATPase subunit H|nr:ATPase [Christensenellaceae bacterium]
MNISVTELINHLSDALENASPVPLTGKRLVDVETCLDIVAELRNSLPDNIKQAEMIVRDRDRILREADLQAQDIIHDAEMQFNRLVNDDSITLEAQRRAKDIIASARHQADEDRVAADEYIDEMLASLEKYTRSIFEDVRNNRQELGGGPAAE